MNGFLRVHDELTPTIHWHDEGEKAPLIVSERIE
jgi:hypothetical protein